MQVELAACRLVADQRADRLAVVGIEEVAAVGDGNAHHAEEVPLHDIGLEADLPALELPAPAHAAHIDQPSLGPRDVEDAGIGEKPVAQDVVTPGGGIGQPDGHEVAPVESHVVIHHVIVLQTDEARGRRSARRRS